MKVSVYYRGCAGKLHQIDVNDVDHPDTAVSLVAEELKSDPFAKKPFLGMVLGGQK